jgi:hypothetical protein
MINSLLPKETNDKHRENCFAEIKISLEIQTLFFPNHAHTDYPEGYVPGKRGMKGTKVNVVRPTNYPI